MKKRLAALLLLTVLLSLAACGGNTVQDQATAESAINEGTNTDDATIKEVVIQDPDQIEIDRVEALIEKIPGQQPGSKDEIRRQSIKEAREAYDALPEDLQQQIGNLDLLLEAEASLPFAEKEGLRFEVPETIVTPISAKFSPEDKTLEPTVCESPVALPVPNVTCTEADVDGYVVYTITINTEIKQGIEHDKLQVMEQNRGWLCYHISTLGIYDYYTGRYLGSSEEVSTCPSDGRTIYRSVVEYNGIEYDVTIKEDKTLKCKREYNSSFYEDRTTNTIFLDAVIIEYDYDNTISIRVPENYDGLMIAVRGPDETAPEYEDMSNFNCEEHRFTVEEPTVRFWEGNPENWVFIRVNDLLQPQA